MSTEDDQLQPITEEDVQLKPYLDVPLDVPESTGQAEPSGPDGVSAFDARYRDPFLGLLFIGKLSSDENILGHTFSLETPTEAERLETGLLHKKYLNSLSSEIAWAAVMVAAYLRKVDGSPLPEPIGPKDTGLTGRLNWVLENLKRPVIQRVFERCLILDSHVSDIIDELETLGEE